MPSINFSIVMFKIQEDGRNVQRDTEKVPEEEKQRDTSKDSAVESERKVTELKLNQCEDELSSKKKNPPKKFAYAENRTQEHCDQDPIL